MSCEANFLQRHLPDPQSEEAIYDDLLQLPSVNAGELRLSPLRRRRLVARRLSNYFNPGTRQIALFEDLIEQIRSGYEGRGRSMAEHERRVREVARLHQEGRLIADGDEVQFTSKSIGLDNTARSSVLLGTPGMGKTLSIEEVLRRIPERVVHRDGMQFTQVCWIKLDCPSKGTVKSLCIDFFTEMDRVLRHGQHQYQKLYAALRTAEDLLMSRMALVANLHALGVLVIDEVQHLAGADGRLLAFLVTLINRIGVPVVLIGTTDAVDVLGESMRIGRRGVGPTSGIWDRFDEADPEWISFVEDLWRYQWTTEHTPLSGVLQEKLYHHSQGVIDLAIKLFLLTQMRAIRIGAASGRAETITPKLLDVVAGEEMALVAPLLRALRSGDRTEVARYKDLTSLTRAVARMIQSDLGADAFVVPENRRASSSPKSTEPEGADAAFDKVFLELGIGLDAGRDLLAEIRAGDPGAGFFDIIDAIRAALRTGAPKAPKSKRKVRDGAATPPIPEGDLRWIVSKGEEEGRTAHMSLIAAGLAGPASYFKPA